MIENDLPQGVLTEKKYQKVKGKLKKIAYIVWGLSILIAGIIFISSQINNGSNNNSSNEKTALKQELLDIETKIDTEKKAIFPTYETTSSYSINKVGWDEYERINNELDAVDLKYVDDVQAIADKAGIDMTVNGDSLSFYIKSIKSSLDFETDKGKSQSSFNSFFAIPVLMFGGMIGLFLMIAAHQREMAAYGMQGTLPVASEGMGKMVKSLDDNGTLDIIAETGAKMMGKQAEAQIKHDVPQKVAKLQRAQVEAQNETGATELSAKQQGKFAEEIGKGLKKGLFKK